MVLKERVTLHVLDARIGRVERFHFHLSCVKTTAAAEAAAVVLLLLLRLQIKVVRQSAVRVS